MPRPASSRCQARIAGERPPRRGHRRPRGRGRSPYSLVRRRRTGSARRLRDDVSTPGNSLSRRWTILRSIAVIGSSSTRPSRAPAARSARRSSRASRAAGRGSPRRRRRRPSRLGAAAPRDRVREVLDRVDRLAVLADQQAELVAAARDVDRLVVLAHVDAAATPIPIGDPLDELAAHGPRPRSRRLDHGARVDRPRRRARACSRRRAGRAPPRRRPGTAPRPCRARAEAARAPRSAAHFASPTVSPVASTWSGASLTASRASSCA